MAAKARQRSWECQHCTSRNNIKAQRCTVCYHARSKPNQHPQNNGVYPALMGSKSDGNKNDILKRGPLQKKGNGVFDGWKTRLCILQT